MKTRMLTIIMLIFTFGFAYGQENPNNSKLDKNVVEISQLKSEIAELKSEIIELKEKAQWKNEIFEQRLQQASDTIANQNSLFDGFGVLYGIITVIIALIGIALPILTYQFGIKPSQNALKEFENNADKKMEDFLEKSRNKQIEQAIENIKSQNPELKSNATTFLSLTQHQGFTDEQLYKLFLILKSADIDETTKGQIAFSISNKKSDYATEYFTTALQNNYVNIKYAAIKYFVNIGFDNHLNIFRDLISKSENKYIELVTLLTWLYSLNKNSILTVINNKDIVDSLDQQALKTLKGALPSLNKTWRIEENEFEKSYLNEMVKKASSQQA